MKNEPCGIYWCIGTVDPGTVKSADGKKYCKTHLKEKSYIPKKKASVKPVKKVPL